jgi:hypothetical protein
MSLSWAIATILVLAAISVERVFSAMAASRGRLFCHLGLCCHLCHGMAEYCWSETCLVSNNTAIAANTAMNSLEAKTTPFARSQDKTLYEIKTWHFALEIKIINT